MSIFKIVKDIAPVAAAAAKDVAKDILGGDEGINQLKQDFAAVVKGVSDDVTAVIKKEKTGLSRKLGQMTKSATSFIEKTVETGAAKVDAYFNVAAAPAQKEEVAAAKKVVAKKAVAKKPAAKKTAAKKGLTRKAMGLKPKKA